jgi:hypothetical protein
MVTNEWGYQEDEKFSSGTKRRVTKGGEEFVHEVAEIVSEDQTLPIEKYNEPSLALVMGVVPPLGEDADLYMPIRLMLKFRP